MTIFKGRNTNTNDAPIKSNVSVNSATSQVMFPANPDRIGVTISNVNNQDAWVKLQAASVDNLLDWIWLPKLGIWKMTTDNIYTGEISVLMATGGLKILNGVEL